MSIQTIIDNATSITIDKRKTAAQTVSRSGVVLTAERATNRPYRFTVSMHEGLTYSDNRAVLEELDNLDITEEETIDIGSTNTGLSYITALRGTLGGSPTISTIAGNAMVINTTGATGSGIALKAGDFIQPATGYRYPYQVVNDVTWNSSSITVTLHRPYIAQSGYSFSGKGLTLGSNVSWRVKMARKVDYSIVPYDRISFNGNFELVEIITV